MDDVAQERYPFWIDAMLPAWFVTSADLVIRNHNRFATELLETVGKEDLLGAQGLSVALRGVPSGRALSSWSGTAQAANRCESLWTCLLKPECLRFVTAALEILESHLAILEAFNSRSRPIPIGSFAEELRAVRSSVEGITPYVLRPRPGPKPDRFIIAVKISPAQGLELIKEADVEGAAVRFVDVVMAYKLDTEWVGDEIAHVGFVGLQPAIHDATERHHLWMKSRRQDEARITQFLAHAFKTPLANSERLLKTMRLPALEPRVRDELSVELESLIGDVHHLVRLLLFINTTEDIHTVLRRCDPETAMPTRHNRASSTTISVGDVVEIVGTALQSVHSLRTGRRSDVNKIDLLLAARALPPVQDDASGSVAPYVALARSLVALDGLESDSCFEIRSFVKSGRLDAENVAEKAKTILLNLVLVELVVNAVRYADEVNPRVSVAVALNAQGDQFELAVYNNGEVLSDAQFADRGDAADSPGEKRRRLGLLLNQRATALMDWQFSKVDPSEPGTLLLIRVPVELGPTLTVG